MKGTILDFLKLATEKEALAKELLELATKYEFEFTDDELSDGDLDAVAGGGSGDDAQLANVEMQNAMQTQQQAIQMMGQISKLMHDSSMAGIRKIGG